MQISVFYDHILEANEQTGKSIPEILDTIKSYGISALECSIDSIRGKEAEMLNMFNNAGLNVAEVYGTFQLQEKAALSKAMQFVDSAALMNSKKVLIIPGFLAPHTLPLGREIAIHKMADALIKLTEYAQIKGITVTMEDFDDKIAPFSTDDELLWFMEHVPLLRCAFDTGNFLYQDIDVLSAFPKLSKYIAHVHCKDRALVGLPGEAPKLTVSGKALYTASVGHGCIPMTEIFKLLHEINYDDYLVIEHFGAPDQMSCIKESADFIKENF